MPQAEPGVIKFIRQWALRPHSVGDAAGFLGCSIESVDTPMGLEGEGEVKHPGVASSTRH